MLIGNLKWHIYISHMVNFTHRFSLAVLGVFVCASGHFHSREADFQETVETIWPQLFPRLLFSRRLHSGGVSVWSRQVMMEKLRLKTDSVFFTACRERWMKLWMMTDCVYISTILLYYDDNEQE